MAHPTNPPVPLRVAVDLDSIILRRGNGDCIILTDFLTGPGRTSAIRVASDYDYVKIRYWLREDNDDDDLPLSFQLDRRHEIPSAELGLFLSRIKYGNPVLPVDPDHPPMLRLQYLQGDQLLQPDVVRGPGGRGFILPPNTDGGNSINPIVPARSRSEIPGNENDDDDLYDASPRRNPTLNTTPGQGGRDSLPTDDPFTPDGPDAQGTPVRPRAAGRANYSVQGDDDDDNDDDAAEPPHDEQIGDISTTTPVEHNLGQDAFANADPQVWARACIFFQCPEDIRNLKLPGLRLPLKDYQLVAIYRILTQCKKMHIASAILGDEMGLGKTATVIASIVVARSLRLLWQEVIYARRNPGRGRQHLPARAGQAVCPSQAAITSEYGVHCLCVSGCEGLGVITHVVDLPVLLIVPPKYAPTWAAEWERFVDLGERSPAKDLLLRAANRNLLADRKYYDQNLAARLHAPIDSFIASEDEEAVRPGLRAIRGLYKDGSRYVVLISSANTASFYKEYNEPNTVYSVEQPDRNQGKKFTSNRLVASMIFCDEFHSYRGADDVSRTLPFRFVRNVTANSAYPTILVGVSGSGFASGPHMWRPFVHHAHAVADQMIEVGRPGWEDVLDDDGFIPTLRAITDQEAYGIVKANWTYLGKYISSEDERDRERVQQRLADVKDAILPVLPLLFIRRLAKGEFRGHIIVPLPPCEFIVRACPLPNGPARDAVTGLTIQVEAWVRRQLSAAKGEWNRQGRVGDKPTKLSIQRQILAGAAARIGGAGIGHSDPAWLTIQRSATYPTVASLRDSIDGTEFDAQELNRVARLLTGYTTGGHRPQLRQGMRNLPFWPHRSRLAGESPKFQALCGYIDEMMRLRDEPVTSDNPRYPDKTTTHHMVVFADTTQTAFLTFMLLYHRYNFNEDRIKLLYAHAGLSTSATTVGNPDNSREGMRNIVQRVCGPRDPNVVLVTTYRLFSDGYNLQRASRAILLEMPHDEHTQKQAIGRIHRQGQLMPTKVVQLYDPGNLFEYYRYIANENSRLLTDRGLTEDDIRWETFGAEDHGEDED